VTLVANSPGWFTLRLEGRQTANNGSELHALLRPRFDGAYLMGGGLDQARAEALIADGRADATVFGTAFLANPDLPERFLQGAALNAPDKDTFYSPGAKGYTDYPALDSN